MLTTLLSRFICIPRVTASFSLLLSLRSFNYSATLLFSRTRGEKRQVCTFSLFLGKGLPNTLTEIHFLDIM